MKRQQKKTWRYPDIEFSRWPGSHCSRVPVPIFTSLHHPDQDGYDRNIIEAMGYVCDSSSNSSSRISHSYLGDFQTVNVTFYVKGELKDLVRDLALS